MNTDNQQEIGLVAWLAGIIDGEGTVSLSINKRRKQMIRSTPKVIIGNTDQGIIDKCVEAITMIGVGKYLRIKRPAPRRVCGVMVKEFKQVTTIEVGGFKRVRTLLLAVQPWLAGEKAKRAELLLTFIEGRIGYAESSKKAQNVTYRQEDVDNALAFLRVTRTKHIDDIAKILNEHTREIRRSPETRAKMGAAKVKYWAEWREKRRIKICSGLMGNHES